MYLSKEDEICVGAPEESKGAGKEVLIVWQKGKVSNVALEVWILRS